MASFWPEAESASCHRAAVAKSGEASRVTRRMAVRPVRWAAQKFAPIVALAVTATIIVLALGLLAVRFVGLNAYVVQGGPTESMVPIGSLVLTAPSSTGSVVAIDDSGDATQGPTIGTAWVAIPTLGYAVTYAEAYASPIVMGLIVWVLFVFALRALEPHMSSARRRLPA
jgi:hypothetical protein